MHQLRIPGRNQHCHHPALGSTEETNILKSQLLHLFCCIPGHICHCVNRWNIFPPVNKIDGEVLVIGPECVLYSIPHQQDTLDTESRQHHQSFISGTEFKIVHSFILTSY